MASWPSSSENEAQQGWEEENSFTQIPILIWQTTASQTPRLSPRWGHKWWRRYTLWIFFFFSLFLPWKVFLLIMHIQFPIIDLRLSLERNLFLSTGLSLPEDNIFRKGHLLIPYQEDSSSGQNVFIPSSGAETLKLNITDVKREQRVCWTFKRTLDRNENSVYGDILYFLSKRRF